MPELKYLLKQMDSYKTGLSDRTTWARGVFMVHINGARAGGD
jgi:hypothetical protein